MSVSAVRTLSGPATVQVPHPLTTLPPTPDATPPAPTGPPGDPLLPAACVGPPEPQDNTKATPPAAPANTKTRLRMSLCMNENETEPTRDVNWAGQPSGLHRRTRFGIAKTCGGSVVGVRGGPIESSQRRQATGRRFAAP